MVHIVGIYQIRCSVNQKVYIGSSCDIRSRMSAHMTTLKRNVHPNKFLQRAYNKYGATNFVYDILEECDKESLFEIEQEWLDIVQPYRPEIGYNLSKFSDKPQPQIKTYIVMFPDGHEEEINNLNQFCNDKGLNVGNLCQTAHGGARSCKGYKCRLPGDTWKDWEKKNRKHESIGNPRKKEEFFVREPNSDIDIYVEDLYKFCEDRNLRVQPMRSLARGKNILYKNYHCRYSHQKYEDWLQNHKEQNRILIDGKLRKTGNCWNEGWIVRKINTSEEIYTENLSKFGRENNVDYRGLLLVAKGECNYFHKYICYRSNITYNEWFDMRASKTKRNVYTIVHPDGKIENIFEIKSFCIKHKIYANGMSAAFKEGKRIYKDYSIYLYGELDERGSLVNSQLDRTKQQ